MSAFASTREGAASPTLTGDNGHSQAISMHDPPGSVQMPQL
jgi:hypothetical protein